MKPTLPSHRQQQVLMLVLAWTVVDVSWPNPILEVVDHAAKQDVADVRLRVLEDVDASQEEHELDADEADHHDAEETVSDERRQQLLVREQQHRKTRHL